MSKARRLGLVLLLNLLLVAALVIVGVVAHSLGVLAAGVDYLADAAAIGVSLMAIRLAPQPARRRQADPTHFAALVNAGWLLALNVGVVFVAIRRLFSGITEVHGLPVLIVSAAAAVVMLVGAVILGGDLYDENTGEDLNMKAVLLDTASDAAAAGGVAISGAVIFATHGWYWLDPGVAFVIAVVIGYHALVLIWRVLVALKPTPHRATSSAPASACGPLGKPGARPGESDLRVLAARYRQPSADRPQ
ncbi:MAG TPA: cation diffusion facilitator family transporter [Mycobacterium sp.]|jgi:cation diffusion facilitator family transporter